MFRSVGRRAFPAVLLFLLAALGGGARALACSCRSQPLCEAYSGSGAVFVGTVLSFTEREAYRKWEGGKTRFVIQASRLRVEESFTDLDGAPEVLVETEAGSGCGLRLAQGARYLIDGRRLGGPGRFVTGLCTRTAPAEHAAEDLAYLRAAVRDKPGATISGRVAYDGGSGDEETPYSDVEPLGVKTVVLEGEGGRREARIGPGGSYSFGGVAAGKYKLYASLPDGLTDSDPLSPGGGHWDGGKGQREITINGRGCLSRDIEVRDDGRVSGRVLDENGAPAAYVTVNLLHITLTGKVRGDSEDVYEGLATLTDGAGNYRFLGLRPGGYLIGVRIGRHIVGTAEAARPETFYPGVPTREQAVVVPLGKGESVTGHDFQLQPRYAERVIAGRVVWRDGRAAANARVRYSPRTPDRKLSGVTHFDTDADGNFSFVGYEGTAYLVGAFKHEDVEGGPTYAREVEVPPQGEVGALRLTLDQHGSSSRDFYKFQK